MEQRDNRTVGGGQKSLSEKSIRAIEGHGFFWQGPKDLYYNLMSMPISGLLAILVAYLLVVNLVFTFIYVGMGGLSGWFIGVPGSIFGRFANAFFFSVQTLSTTGYGTIYPATLHTNIVASVEILLGQLNIAVSTGVLFARLSRPHLRVMFSKVGVVHNVGGVQTLSFRVANRRRGDVSEAHMSVVMLAHEEDPEFGMIHRMLPLKLEQDTSPIFGPSWMVSHKITPDSPLWGMTYESLAAADNIFICLLTGTDEALNATVSARHVYRAEDLRFNHRFIKVVNRSPNGEISIDHARFHDTEPSLQPLATASDIW